MRAMEVRHATVKDLPLQLGLAISGMTMVLHVFIGDNDFVRKIEVARICLSASMEDHLHAFFVC